MTGRKRPTKLAAPRHPRGATGASAAHRPRKTAEFVAQRIVANIIDTDQQPGAMLPSEKAMLVEYGIGRGSLREALRFLEIQGVLRMKPGPGGGPSVDHPTSRPLASTLALLLAIDRTPFSAILDVRQTLEPTLAARSAQADDDENLRELEATVTAMHADASDPNRTSAHNRRFHDLIAVRAGNPVFAHLVMALNWIIDGAPLGVHFPAVEVHAAADAHGRILDAISAKDPDAAHEAMRRHLSEFTTYLQHHYEEILARPLRWEHLTY